jgi:hypothetical protein
LYFAQSTVQAAGHERWARTAGAEGVLASAQNNVMRLVKLGILKEVTGRKRDRIFIAPEILQLTGASELGE